MCFAITGCDDDNNNANTRNVEDVDLGFVDSEILTLSTSTLIRYEEGDLGINFLSDNGEWEVVPTTNTIILEAVSKGIVYESATVNNIDGICKIYFRYDAVDFGVEPNLVRPIRIDIIDALNVTPPTFVTRRMYIDKRNDISYEEGDLSFTLVSHNFEWEIVPTEDTVIMTHRNSCSGFSVGSITDIWGPVEVIFEIEDADYTVSPKIIRPTKIFVYNPECEDIDISTFDAPVEGCEEEEFVCPYL